MNIRKSILTFLCFLFLIGQIPYGYLYCPMMKQTVTMSMLTTCCMMQHTSQHGSVIVSSNQFEKLKSVSKETVDKFEHTIQNRLLPGANTFTAFNSSPAVESSMELKNTDTEHPPPDLILTTSNLRI